MIFRQTTTKTERRNLLQTKAKKKIRRKNGVPVDTAVCLGEASDMLCRATYRAVNKVYGDKTDTTENGAKTLKEFWSVLKEATAVTENLSGDADKNTITVIMDENAESLAE